MEKEKKKNVVSLFLRCFAMLAVVGVCCGTRLPVLMRSVGASGVTQQNFTEAPMTTEATDVREYEVENRNSQKVEAPTKDTKPTEEDENEEEDAEGDTRQFPVIESTIGGSGQSYDNFFVKNYTDYALDIESMITRDLGFQTEDTTDPQVLIVHTHATEAYLESDEGFYDESYTGRSTDPEKSIVRVGEAIAEKLKAKGIATIHDTTMHDKDSYNGSYDRSEQTIYNNLEKYPSIKIVLDIHRDSIGNGGVSGKIKPTFLVDGKKAAQIMIMSGYDADGSYGFEHWDENLTFALKLQRSCETLYPGMTRPLNFGDFAYNMFINNGSLIVEIGTDMNTLEEAIYSGELLGDALADVVAQRS